MDFTLPPEIEDIRRRTRAFIDEHVLPLEADRGNYDDHENIRMDLLVRVWDQAKAAGLWAPQAPKEFGGMGLPVVGWAAMYEEANRSIFGPVALNCCAPDDGNMNVLAKVSPAGASSAVSRSWGRRSMAAIASWNSTGWKSRTRTS
jgi:acyl-CoA dehydrogenase